MIELIQDDSNEDDSLIKILASLVNKLSLKDQELFITTYLLNTSAGPEPKIQKKKIF